jgi:hypothetical protein
MKKVPSQNHGIRYISALKLVEAENARTLRDVRGYKGYTIKIASVLHLHLVQPFMHILHEVVEVDPPL